MTPDNTPIPSSASPTEASEPNAGRCAVATGSAFRVPWLARGCLIIGSVDATVGLCRNEWAGVILGIVILVCGWKWMDFVEWDAANPEDNLPNHIIEPTDK